MRAGTDSSLNLTPEAARAAAERRVEQLLDRCERTESTTHRISILQEVARTYEEDLDEPDTALVVLVSALDYDYGFDPVASEIERLATELDEWSSLLEERLKFADELADDEPARAADLWVRIARWYYGALDEAEYAVDALRSALEHDENHTGALRWLAEMLRENKAWFELGEVIERQASAEADADARRELHLALGRLAETHLDDAEWAVSAYRRALEDEPGCTDALDALQRLYRRSERWDALLDVLATKADATEDVDERLALELESARLLAVELDERARARRLIESIGAARAADALAARIDAARPEHRAPLYWLLGWIRADMLDDLSLSERCFTQALVTDPAHLPSLLSLAALYERRGDWQKAVNALSRAEDHMEAGAAKLELVQRSAEIYRVRLDDAAQAQRCFETVLRLDRDNRAALKGLADIHYAAEKWRLLAPVLDRVLVDDPPDAEDADEVAELGFRAARCAEALDQPDKALAFYAAACDAAPDRLDILRHRADLQFAREDWLGAAASFEAILAAHAGKLTDDERARVHRGLGEIYKRRGERDRALDRFETALLFAPHDRASLEAFAELRELAGEWDAVVRAKQTLMTIADEHERAELLEQCAAIERDQRNDPHAALAAYEELAELRPRDHALLQNRLDLYSQTGMWESALEVIDRFVELETDPLRRGKYLQAAATICRDEIGDRDRAVELFDGALDAFFTEPDRIDAERLRGCMKAFAAIDAILTEQRAWKQQERAYRRMIKRLRPGAPLLGELWHGLGEIYRTRLKQQASAIAAFEVAARLDPDNVQRREILAELYVLAGPDMADKSASTHLSMLARDAYKVDSYNALFDIYRRTQQWDRAWCVCRALVFMQRANAGQRELFERYHQRRPQHAIRQLTEEMWKRIVPSGAHRYVSAILGAVAEPAALEAAGSARGAGLRGEPIDVEQHPATAVRMLRYASQVLAVPLPDVYVAPDRPGMLFVHNSRSGEELAPAIAIHGDALRGGDDAMLAFHTARAVSYLRPEYLLRVALTDAQLHSALATAVRVARPDVEVKASTSKLLPIVERRLGPGQREQLRAIVDRFLDSGSKVNFEDWRRAVDATARRAGLLLCGDLETAARLSAAAVDGGGADAVRELLLYSVSDEHAVVRRHLGTVVAAS